MLYFCCFKLLNAFLLYRVNNIANFLLMQPGLRLVNLWSMIWTMKMKTGSRNSTLKENLYHPKSMSLLTFDMLMLHMQPNYFGII